MLSEKDSFELKALRARVKELDNEVLRAIDSRNFTTADKLDRMRVKLWKRIDEIEGVKRKHNPARKPAAKRAPAKKSAYVNRPSQATKKAPSKRLKARRAANVRGSGMFPNPASKVSHTLYAVEARSSGPWGDSGSHLAYAKSLASVEKFALRMANKYNKPFAVVSFKTSDSRVWEHAPESLP